MADWTSLLSPNSRAGQGGQNDYIARMLMEQGTDNSPIQSPFQGLARLAQAYVGKQRMDAGAAKSAEGNQALADILAPATNTVTNGPQQSAPLPGGGTLDYQNPVINTQADPKNAEIAALLNGGIGQEQFTTQALDQLGFGKKKDPLKGAPGDVFFDQETHQPIPGMSVPNRPVKPTAPTIHSFTDGDKTVDKQFNPETGAWDVVSSGPRYKPPSQGGEETATLSDPAIVNAAVRYNQTGTLPPLGNGKAGAQLRAQILDTSAKLATGKFSPEQLVGNMANYKANSASLGQQTKQFNAMEQNANAAQNSAQLALKAARLGGAGPTGSPAINRWIQAGRQNIAGDKDVMALNSHLSTYGEEYAKVMTGATGNQAATDSARAEAHKRLSSANNVEQLERVISEMNKEMGGRHYAGRSQIESIQHQLSGESYHQPDGVQTKPPPQNKGSDPLGIR